MKRGFVFLILLFLIATSCGVSGQYSAYRYQDGIYYDCVPASDVAVVPSAAGAQLKDTLVIEYDQYGWGSFREPYDAWIPYSFRPYYGWYSPRWDSWYMNSWAWNNWYWSGLYWDSWYWNDWYWGTYPHYYGYYHYYYPYHGGWSHHYYDRGKYTPHAGNSMRGATRRPSSASFYNGGRDGSAYDTRRSTYMRRSSSAPTRSGSSSSFERSNGNSSRSGGYYRGNSSSGSSRSGSSYRSSGSGGSHRSGGSSYSGGGSSRGGRR